MKKTNQLHLVLGVTVLLGVGTGGPVRADDLHLDVSGFAGYHVFSGNNELGAIDVPDAVTVENAFVFGLRAAYFFMPRLAAEVEAGMAPASTTSDTGVRVYVWRLSARYHLPDLTEKTRPFALVGLGGMTGDSSDESMSLDDTDFVTHVGLGLEQRIWRGWGVRGDARLLFPPSTASEFLTTDFEVLVGIYNALDQKPPPPPSPSDRDGDGILDPEDRCPDKAEDFDGFEDRDGCPEPDNDADGIADGSDQCPLRPEDKDGFEDENGCPDPDNDGDKIEDSADRCPDDAEDVDEFEDEDGCPDPDNDGDGIEDADDKCPLEPETRNGYEDDDGCPDKVPVAVKRFSGTIKGITFHIRSAKIRPSSFATLDKAVEVLKQYPKIKLEIQGHTDDTGTEEFNQDLSERRAESVKAYLVSKGIAEDRLTTKGFGESQPEVPNTSKANRKQNRRVVFRLIQ